MAGKRASYFADEHLEIVDLFEKVNENIEQLLKSSKGLLAFVKKRVIVEKERIRTLNKYSSSIVEESTFKSITFQGVFGQSWKGVRDQVQSESLQRSHIITTVEEKVVQPLQVFLLSDLEKRFRHIVTDGRKVVRDYLAVRSQLHKSRDRYFSCCAEWETSLNVLYREYGTQWNPSPGNKLYEKEQQISRKVDEARSDYTTLVDNVITEQERLTLSQLPQALELIKETADQMVSVVHTAINTFENLLSSLVGNSKPPPQVPEHFVVTNYTQTFLFNNIEVTDLPPPRPYDFEEYTYSDEVLLIQARKTQYQAMSLLTPAEMISAGQRFFAAGDRQTAGRNKASPTSSSGMSLGAKMIGLNPLLVEVCIEFLQQPIAMEEEGLFRVPGDSKVVKGLHAQFMTVGSNLEQLRYAVLEQKDPNNVSGLLKLHLRENHILTSSTSLMVQNAMAGTYSVEATSAGVQQLLSLCPPRELKVLSSIITFMAELVSEPWKSKNKMTPRTLGIACGLSLFPQLDPGQATQVLEYLIKHTDELQQTKPA